ncbi:putative membrane protein YfcA [Bradyrhizobium japonicum]
MPDVTTLILLSVAVFAGAFVSGLSGFAFSAVAGTILLRMFQPLEAVPLMMACSIGVQATNLWALRRSIRWEGSLLLIVGGLIGVPIAVSLLQSADTHLLRRGFGIMSRSMPRICCCGRRWSRPERPSAGTGWR